MVAERHRQEPAHAAGWKQGSINFRKEGDQIIRGDDQVATDHPFKTSAHRVTVGSRDIYLCRVTHRPSHILEGRDVVADDPLILRDVLKLFEVFAGAERATSAAKHNSANFFRSFGAINCR